MQAPRWVLIWRSQGGKKKLAAAAAVVQLATRGLGFHLAYDIWQLTDWFLTACCLSGAWGTFKK
jgi:hypothetical protein